jgi:hypothetical protein
MRKLIITTAFVCILGTSANATISINFAGASAGIGIEDGTALGDLWNGSLFVELLWAPSSLTAAPSFTPGIADAGHFILWSSTITTASGLILEGDLDGTASYTASLVGGGDISAGFVYGRIFDDASAPTLWTYVNLDENGNPAVAGPSNPTASPPQTAKPLDLRNLDSVFDADNGLYITAMIPEPSVMALMGLGGLLVAIRRRRMIA